MRPSMLLVLTMLITHSAMATDAAQLMSGLTWEKRVLLVFAPADDHRERRHQRALLDAVEGGLGERDMTVIEVFGDERLLIDGRDQSTSGAGFYDRYGVDLSEFRVILVGKDGSIKLERERAVDSADLFALIDSMPMRRYEMLQDD